MVAYAKRVLRLRWPIIAVTCLIVAICGYGVSFLAFNPDTRLFFGPDDPGRIALDRMENTYTKVNNVIFVLAPKSRNVFTREVLAVIDDLTEQAWRTPYSSRVNSLTNYQHSYARDNDLIVEDLVDDPLAMTDVDLARTREIALGEPALVDLLVAADAAVTAVSVDIVKSGNNREEVPEIVAFARELRAAFEQAHPEIDFYLTGGVMADITFSEAGDRDTETLIPLMFGLIVLTLVIALGTFTGSFTTVVIIIFSVVTAVGIAGWVGFVLNSATAGVPIVVMTLALADCVHVLATMRQCYRPGTSKSEAIVESLRVNAWPIAITSITTAIGFLTLNFSESPPLREFGNMVAIGMVAAFVFSVTVFPAMLAVLPMDQRGHRSVALMSGAMDRLADFVIRRRKLLLGLGPIVLVGLGVGITQLTLDDDFVRYFDDSFEFRRDTDFMRENLTGLNAIHYSLAAGEDYGVVEPEFLDKLDRFAGWFREQEKVTQVSVLTDILKRLNQNMHGDDPAWYLLPDDRKLAAQYLFVYEMSLPFGRDLNHRVDVAKSETRLTVHLRDVTSAEVRALGRQGELWLEQNAPELATQATGLSVVYAHMSERNIRSMMGGTLIALLLISGCLLFLLKSIPIGIVSLVPNLVPAAMAIGLWGYVSGEVNLAISVVGAMTLGIVVDDTVHILNRYLRGRREHGMDATEAVRYSFRTVGVPVVVTSLALFLGFGVLSLSGFAISGQMGVLSAITVAFAPLADLLFLPPLLILLGKFIR